MQPSLSSSLRLSSPPTFSGQLWKVPSGARKLCMSKISASETDTFSNHDYNGKLVDESMIVLRMRIREMKMLEKKDEPPLHWMGWERRYYANYNSDVLEIVGFLQSKLLDTRPGLALGTMALVLLSVPTSVAVVMFYFVGLITGL